MQWRSLYLMISLGTVAITLPTTNINSPETGILLIPIQPSEEQLCQRAKIITVKILNPELIGSGIILRHQENVYTVLTNNHVIASEDKPLQIETYDGKVHQATIIKTQNLAANDLGLLKFTVTTDTDSYQIAQLGKSSHLAEGEQVFVAGFPISFASNQSQLNSQNLLVISNNTQPQGFVFRKGKIISRLDKALEGGYQIGYTNDIEKGMSGGPLLNAQGELIGINGRHAYPLWEAPDYYEDGSSPTPDTQELINHYSWAIPIEKVVQFFFDG